MTVVLMSTDKETDKQHSSSDLTVATIPKVKRAPHNKVKTGCYTCRRRHIKCDEAKPFCRTCSTSGYTCCGYSTMDPVRLVVVPPPASLRGRDEYRAFQFFMETTLTWFDFKSGPCISEGHVNDFWNPVVLQVTESEPAIKHILLAWAELHRRILYEPVSPNEPFENDFFWQNHGQALRLLGSNKHIDTSVILIACIMFCVLENFRGRRDIFLKHLESGMRILNDYDRRLRTRTEGEVGDDMISRYLRPILMAFHLNLANILELELLQPQEKMADRLIKLRQAGRVIKSWN